jgi:hypothetical protein
MVIVGLLTGDEQRRRDAVDELAHDWGEPELWGAAEPFGTTYYEAEMGAGLSRTFVGFSRLVSAPRLSELKNTTWALEQRLTDGGRRRVNLDPGSLDATKVVLASFKPGPYKLYLGGSIWADLVLYFANGAFQALPWTFPDLRTGSHLEFFTRARARYKGLLRSWRRGRPPARF